MGVGDKLTWAYRSLFIIMLLWLRFLDQYVTAWGILLIWAVILFFIFRKPRVNQETPKG